MFGKKSKKRAERPPAWPAATDESAAVPATPNGSGSEVSAPESATPETSPPETAATAETTAPAPEMAASEPSSPPAEEPAPGPEAQEAAQSPQPVAATAGNGGREKPLSRFLSKNQLLNDAPRASEEQRQREAAAELEAAFAPSRQLLLQEVPDASTPEEAARRLEEQQRDPLPDPEAESLSKNDIYWSDASVYYRVRKQFKWGPQKGPYRQPWTPPAGLAQPTRSSPRGRLPSV